MLRGADFNNGTQDSFAVDSGVWEVKQGALSVGAASLGKDAAAVFYLDDYKPIYFEITALVKVQKPLAGWKANAYLIFDYFSPTDFKFAGIDVSINKVVMGHRDASGWQVDVADAVPGQARRLLRDAGVGQRHDRQRAGRRQARLHPHVRAADPRRATRSG